ncbi:MAG: helix-turn-helix transcriptional regulator [Candidatus Margulisbacteria bacterium]|nr:helix-turn-helix transcriptional regulator [Candidatus Margulisiibacteriota bacterium]
MAIRGYRYREGYSQKALSEKLNISSTNLSKMETGKRPVGKRMAKKLAEVLKADTSYFLTDLE